MIRNVKAKQDPTRTATLRRAHTAAVRRGFRRLRAAILRLVVTDDAFGLRPIKHTLNVFCATGKGGGVDPSCKAGDFADKASEFVSHWTYGKEGVAPGSDKSVITPTPEVIKALSSARPSHPVMLYRSHIGGSPHGDYESWTTSKDFADHLTEHGEGKRVTLARRVDPSEILFSSEHLPAHMQEHALAAPEVVVANKPAAKMAKLRGEKLSRGQQGHGYVANESVVNPFVSEAQRRACYAKDDPDWDCEEWDSENVTNCQPGQMRGADGKCGPGIGVSIPRDQMPQILKEDTEDFLAYARRLGIGHTKERVDPDTLGPTQAEFRQERVDALPDAALEQPLLVSEDDYVLDGTHRWVRAWQQDHDTVPIIRLHANLGDALHAMRFFPKAKYVANTRWQFATDADKINQFAAWLKAQISAEITSREAEALWEKYAKDAMAKGLGRTFDDVKEAAADDLTFYAGSREQFLKDAFSQPVATDKLKLLAERSYTDLKGVTDDMAVKMRRTLMDGMGQGDNPLDIGKRLADELDISEQRAETIARTELTRAHAEGTLLGMKSMGIEKTTAEIELSAAGDGRMCEECAELDGQVFDIDEASGIIPIHPNCRCSWRVHIESIEPDDEEGDKEQTENAMRQTVSPAVVDRIALMERALNSFCPTGDGGGVDPSCSPGGSAGKAEKPKKDPATMSAASINKELDKLTEESSKLTDQMIEAGRGSETFADIRGKSDPLSKKINDLHSRSSSLLIEVELRAGPNMKRLPKGFGPRTMNQWCPTGPGGGHDNSCGSVGGALTAIWSGVKKALGLGAEPSKNPESFAVKGGNLSKKNYTHQIDSAKGTLAKAGVKDMWATDLSKSADLRAKAVSDPAGFDRDMSKVRLALQGAAKFAGKGMSAAKASLAEKLGQLERLQSDVNVFRMGAFKAPTGKVGSRKLDDDKVEVLEHQHKGESGAGKKNAELVIKHLEKGGTAESAAEHLVDKVGYRASTAKKYVRKIIDKAGIVANALAAWLPVVNANGGGMNGAAAHILNLLQETHGWDALDTEDKAFIEGANGV